MTPQETHQAFLNTTFKVLANPSFDIHINEIVQETNDLVSWAFITAWNPLPNLLSDEENKRRNQQLVQDIESLGLSYSLGIGISADEKWSEESLFIKNINLKKANELAKKYGQLAFVYGCKKEKATLVYTVNQ